MCRYRAALFDRPVAPPVRTPWPVTNVIGPSPNLLEARCDTQTNVREREKKRWPAHVARGRRRRGVPLRLRSRAPCRPGRDCRGRHTPLPLPPSGSVPQPPRGHVPSAPGARAGRSARRSICRACWASRAAGPISPSRRPRASPHGTGSSARSSHGPDPTRRSRGSTTPSTRAARPGPPHGPPRPSWCPRSPRPGSPRSTSRCWSPGRAACDPQHRHLGAPEEPQRQPGGAEAGGDVEMPAFLDHVTGNGTGRRRPSAWPPGEGSAR